MDGIDVVEGVEIRDGIFVHARKDLHVEEHAEAAVAVLSRGLGEVLLANLTHAALEI